MDGLLWPKGEGRRAVYDKDKFKRLVHYVIWKAGKRDWFGATKLNKVLWFADSRVYMLTGKPITGAVYVREKFGPVPHQMMPIRSELEREGSIRVTRQNGLERMVALIPPDMGLFTPDEIKAADHWIEHIATHETAKSISDKSHDLVWEIAAMGEEIPMAASLATRIRDEPSDDAMAWGRGVAQRYGLA